jgi:TatD DNase family protein
MHLVDTHSHLYLEEFDNDLDDVIQRAVNGGVDKIVLPNIDSSTVKRLHILSQKYPDNCFPLMGLHPTHVKENYKVELENVFNQFDVFDYKGIGEIGIDLYWDKTYLNEQIIVFEQQLAFALSKNLPVVIHARDSLDVIFASISKMEFKGLKGIFHAFTGNIVQAEKIINGGFKLGIGGIVTFKNSNLEEIIKSVGLEHLVLETDSPFLAPVPYRGKRNESGYIRIIADKISDITGETFDQVAKVTTNNAVQLFDL